MLFAHTRLYMHYYFCCGYLNHERLFDTHTHKRVTDCSIHWTPLGRIHTVWLGRLAHHPCPLERGIPYRGAMHFHIIRDWCPTRINGTALLVREVDGETIPASERGGWRNDPCQKNKLSFRVWTSSKPIAISTCYYLAFSGGLDAGHQLESIEEMIKWSRSEYAGETLKSPDGTIVPTYRSFLR